MKNMIKPAYKNCNDSKSNKNVNIFQLPKMKNMIKLAYNNWDDSIFNKYVDMLELPLTKKIQTFSKGMMMKASLTIALSHHAELIIMDEPTSGLDPIFRRELLDILHDLMQDSEKTIFFSYTYYDRFR